MTVNHRPLFLGLSLFAFAGGAGAQEGGADGVSLDYGDEIVVTARKRTETVQDVPTSIRSLSGAELGKLGADGIEDIAGQAPGLTVSGNRASAQIFMRGVSTGRVNQDQPEIKETVGLYLDEAPISVQRFSPNLGLYDLERVEVLRGPQGTLYGAGSMAGAIRLITNKPDSTAFGANARGQIAGVDHGGTSAGLDAMVNLPLVSDRLALRAVGSYRSNAGFIDNVTTGEKNANSEEMASGRVALRYTPGDLTTIDATLSYQRSRYDARSIYSEEEGYLKTNVAANEPYLDRNFMAALTVGQEFDAFDATFAGSYRRKTLDYDIEAGAFPGFLTSAPGLPLAVIDNRSRQRDGSAEFRIASKASAALQWTVGIFYEQKRNRYGQDLTVAGIDAASGIDNRLFLANTDQIFVSDIALKERQVALFGEVVVPVGDKLKITGGGRYFDARQRSSIGFGGALADPNTGTSSFRNKEDGFNPKVNIAYELDRDRMVYVQAAKGFRLGGTNEPVPAAACAADLAARGLDAAPQSYASDNLWNYEAGAKTQWFDRALTVNVAAYKIRWKDPQVTAQLGCGFNVYVNAGGLDIEGLELETILRPVEGLSLRGGVGYTDSRLTDDLEFVGGAKGDRAPFIPRWTLTGSVDYTREIGSDLEAFAFLNVQHQGARNTRFDTAAGDNRHLAAYTLVNARVGVGAPNWSVELFAENLGRSRGQTNRIFYPFSLNATTQVEVVTPRTIGIELTLRR